MKHIHLIPVAVFALASLLSSCSSSDKHARNLLARAETVMETHPDSAMLALDSIRSPYRLDRGDMALYALLRTQAMFKTGVAVESDSLIVRAVDYYSDGRDVRRCILAYFYQSRALRNDPDKKLSLNILLKTEEYLPECDDESLLGLVYFDIGKGYQDQLLREEAMGYYKKAQTCFRNTGKQKNEMSTLNHMGWVHMSLKQFVDAEKVFRQELEIAEKLGDSVFICDVSNSLASVYYWMKDYNRAKSFICKGIAHNKTNKPTVGQYLTSGDICRGENRLDSARIFYTLALNDLEQANDTARLIGVYFTLYNVEKENNNFSYALDALEKYTRVAEAIYDQNQRNSIVELKLQYDHEKLVTEKQRLTIRNRSLWLAFSVMLLIAATTVAVHSVVVSRKNKRIAETDRKAAESALQAKEALEKQKEEELKTKDLTIENQKLEMRINELEMRKKQARDLLLAKLNMMQKMNSINQLWSAERKDNRRFAQAAKQFFDEFIFTQDSWREIYEIGNQVISDNFYQKLTQPELDLPEDDIRMCCMIVIGMKTSEIAQILNILPNSVSKKRNRLRKKIVENSDETLKNLLKSWS